MFCRHPIPARGFTLIELMLVVGIVGLLAGMSVSYAGSFRRRELLREATRQSVTTLSVARGEAMRRSARVMVEFQSNRVIGFIDANTNYAYDTGETVVTRYPALASETMPAGIAISSAKLVAGNPGSKTTAIFDYQGFSQNSAGQPLDAVICVRDSQFASGQTLTDAISLTVAGALRVQSRVTTAICP